MRNLSLVYIAASRMLHTWALLGAAPLALFKAAVGGRDTLMHAWSCKVIRVHMQRERLLPLLDAGLRGKPVGFSTHETVLFCIAMCTVLMLALPGVAMKLIIGNNSKGARCLGSWSACICNGDALISGLQMASSCCGTWPFSDAETG